MRTALLILLAFAAQGVASTAWADSTVWKWVDEKGVTHYSDQPVPGATRIEVRAGNIADSSSNPPSGNAPDSDDESPPAAAPAFTKYTDFEIYRPENDQVFPNTGGQVTVEIRINPGLQPTHTMNLYLDGKIVPGYPRNATSFALAGVARGTHNVTATVTDRTGKQLQETNSVVFTVRQESIANPPVGPSQRPPPPKPQPRAGNKMLTSQPTYGALNGGQPAIDPATNLPVVKKPEPKKGKP
jgi:hypothetical protein